MTEAQAPGGLDAALVAGQDRFERWRRTIGLFLGPLSFVVLLLLPLPSLTLPAHRLVAILAWVVVWWVSEAVPIPVTSLLGPALAVLLGVGGAKEIFASFGHPIIFLFLGGFLIAEAMTVHGLDRRIAHRLLASRLIGGSATRILMGFALLAAGLSMWISNTATTAMLFPIALGVAAAVLRLQAEGHAAAGKRTYTTGLLLTCAYGASIGGVATPVGTPPNLIVLGQLDKLTGARPTFVEWMIITLPTALVMLAAASLYLRWRFPPPAGVTDQARAALSQLRGRLGPLRRGEHNVVVAFSVAVGLWLMPGVMALILGGESRLVEHWQTILPESVVALLAAGLLFVLPIDWPKRRFTLSWQEAVRIDWGTLLLFGGGLALGGAMFRTGLADVLGQGLVSLTGARTEVGLTVAFTVFAIYFTELTSNTATATMLAPLAIAAAQATGVSPMPIAVGCALGCSMAFMLPVATPPNAIVYGSGRVPMTAMARTGFWLNLAAAAVIPAGVLTMCRLLGH